MNKYLIKTLLFTLIIMSIWSCKKDENKIYFEGGTAPELKSSAKDSIPLNFLRENMLAVTFSWTNPNYKFNTGISSQDVTYTIEIDTVGASFASINKISKDVRNDLGKAFTQKELNDLLLNSFNLTPEKVYSLEIRLVATLSNKTAALISNIITYNIKPYATPPKVDPPTLGTLWVVGDASNNGWSNPLTAPYDVSQKFTQVSATLYEITMPMKGGGGYKLVQENGVWGSQYHMLAGGTWEGGDFEKKDSDPQFPGAPSAGTYKISVDFQKGKFTVIKL